MCTTRDGSESESDGRVEKELGKSQEEVNTVTVEQSQQRRERDLCQTQTTSGGG